MQTQQIRLARRPVGEPADEDYEITTRDLPPLQDGEVLLRTIYLSLDPYMRGRMSDAKSYAQPLEIGDIMLGQTVCEVVESASDRRSVGDIVLAFTGWQTHVVVPGKHTRKLDPSAAPITTALGVLGMPGFTAYAGLLAIGRPQAGETVVVAAATGPVGSAVGQIARVKGARAVGIAGGERKCRALIDDFGFDAAVDHRAPDFVDQLAAATPDGVDVYFENVGGRVTNAVIDRFNPFARMPVCGVISGYNAVDGLADADRLAPDFLHRILVDRLTIRGFIQDEFIESHHQEFVRDMTEWVADGQVRYREDIVDGLDQAPEAFRGLLAGRNFGKLLVRVGDDPT